MEDSQQVDKTLSLVQENMITLLQRQLDEEIKLDMTEQITTLENIFTRKMETLLTQRMISTINTVTAHMDRTPDRLPQENVRFQIQVQNLTRKLRSTVSVMTLPYMDTSNNDSLSNYNPGPQIDFSSC